MLCPDTKKAGSLAAACAGQAGAPFCLSQAWDDSLANTHKPQQPNLFQGRCKASGYAHSGQDAACPAPHRLPQAVGPYKSTGHGERSMQKIALNCFTKLNL